MKRSEINLRDPFILPDERDKVYYLYGTEYVAVPDGKPGFSYYTSPDLEEWTGPAKCFEKPDNFWADREFTGPEVHFYEGKYYLVASFKNATRSKGIQILFADSPKGPFVPVSETPVTPDTWECLDGTLYIDPNNEPWLVFCRDWQQVKDGEMFALQLTKDLLSAVGEPKYLFSASEADWASDLRGRPRGHYTINGPFIHKSADGTLLMSWSSFNRFGKNATGIARSMLGGIDGPWVQNSRAIYFEDGGHGMTFKTFDGKLMLVMHSPNFTQKEKPLLLEVKEEGNTLKQVR